MPNDINVAVSGCLVEHQAHLALARVYGVRDELL
jgi:hypothetical protein